MKTVEKKKVVKISMLVVLTGCFVVLGTSCVKHSSRQNTQRIRAEFENAYRQVYQLYRPQL